jgi:hypothetical protein
MTAVLVVAAVLALLAIGSQAQSCVPFTGAPRTGHKCDSLVSYPSVLLLANQSYAQVLCSVFHFPLSLLLLHHTSHHPPLPKAGAHWSRTRIALAFLQHFFYFIF